MNHREIDTENIKGQLANTERNEKSITYIKQTFAEKDNKRNLCEAILENMAEKYLELKSYMPSD